MKNNLKNFFIEEYKSYSKFEFYFLISILLFILINSIILHDSIIALFSAIFGILYTINSGKGKAICFYYSILGTFLYSYLSFKNGLYGNLALYLFYYFPIEIIGLFKWKKNINKKTNTIFKEKLNLFDRLKLFLILILGSIITIVIIKYFNGTNPIIDGITTFLSIIGMYLTTKRLVEQYYIWIVVNFLSILMWIKVIINGEKAYSTVIMWIIYFFLGFYFLKKWNDEINKKKIEKNI